jgi:hypothetical protein
MKSNKFAIIVDTQERVPTLIETINKLNFVERKSKKKINIEDLLDLDDVLIFGDESSSTEYELIRNNSLITQWIKKAFGIKHYKVSENFDNIIEELNLFAGNKKQQEDMRIELTIKLPVAHKPKRKVRVFSNFVKVGFDQYNIKIDPFTGYEYVKIDGKRYEIARNIWGRGVLVEV